MSVHYSDRCQKVLEGAWEIACALNRPSVGTEHLLLALAREGSGTSVGLLRRAGVLPSLVQLQIERLVPPEPRSLRASDPAWCPSARAALDLAAVVAKSRGHFYVGNLHLLLALLQQHNTVAAQVMAAVGADRVALRDQALELLASTTGADHSVATS